MPVGYTAGRAVLRGVAVGGRLGSQLVGQFAGNDFTKRDIGEGGAGSGFDERTMAQPQLPDAPGNNVDQQLLIRNHLSCFLQELSGHIAQGTDGARGLGRKLKDGRRAARNNRWDKS